MRFTSIKYRTSGESILLAISLYHQILITNCLHKETILDFKQLQPQSCIDISKEIRVRQNEIEDRNYRNIRQTKTATLMFFFWLSSPIFSYFICLSLLQSTVLWRLCSSMLSSLQPQPIQMKILDDQKQMAKISLYASIFTVNISKQHCTP